VVGGDRRRDGGDLRGGAFLLWFLRRRRLGIRFKLEPNGTTKLWKQYRQKLVGLKYKSLSPARGE